MDRRNFIASLAAGTVLSRMARSHSFAPTDFAPYTVGIQSYTFRSFKLEPALKRMADLGVAHAEFFRNHIPVDSTSEQLRATLKICKDYGVMPVSFGVESFTKNKDDNKKKFDFAAALGVKYLSADPTPDSFDVLDQLCEEYKIAIAIHPHGPSGKGLHRWYSAEVIMKAVKDHHPLIGTCLDTGHLIRSIQMGEKLDPAQQIRVMGKRNFGLHLKDHNNQKKQDVVFGKDGGVLDVDSVLKALTEVEFKGYLAVEYEHNPQDPSKDVQACLDVLKGAITKAK